MFVEYETLNKITKENNSKKFFEAMKKNYRGRKFTGPHGRDIDVRSYRKKKILVSDEPFYNNRLTSVIIHRRNHTEISEIKSELEEKTKEFKLKLIRKGKG